MAADVYAATPVAGGSWSDTVSFMAAANGQPASVVVGSINADPVALDGIVASDGDPVTVTFTLAGAPFQLQLLAVCDIAGGAVFTDGWGGYFLFSAGPLRLGATYDATPGYGQFAAGPPAPACFAAGTRIETHRGLVAVEALRPGDRVRTLLGGAAAPVVWTGFRRVNCATAADPARAWPVRVLAGAFGPGCPRRDVRLSADHAVFVGGVLVPVRYLVNDASIAVEPTDYVTYWHVELPHHDVLLADGLPAESYLDTGNRAGFENAPPLALAEHRPAMQVWASSACAPLQLDPGRQATIRLRLRAQAAALGFRETADAALSLSAAGQGLPTRWDGTRATAWLPAGAREVALDSRSAVPWAQRDDSGDERRLGVAITRISLDGRPLALDGPALSAGWHHPEDGWRWTGGAARVRLPPSRQARAIEIVTAPMLRYWLPSAPAATARAA